jgi:hypothetical protein
MRTATRIDFSYHLAVSQIKLRRKHLYTSNLPNLHSHYIDSTSGDVGFDSRQKQILFSSAQNPRTIHPPTPAVIFLGSKRSGREADHLSQSTAQECKALYLHMLSSSDLMLN